MRIIFISTLIVALFACDLSKKDSDSSVSEPILEEIKLDSLSLEKIFSDSTLKNIESSDINDLAKNLVDTSLFYGLNKSFLKIDSLKKTGGYADYISHLDVGMYKDIRALYLKDIDLGNGKILKLWGFDYASYEACPYSNGKVILISSYRDGKNVACIPFAYFHNWADAPFYDNYITNSILDKKGILAIDETQKSGGIDESDKEYQSKTTVKYQYKLANGIFK